MNRNDEFTMTLKEEIAAGRIPWTKVLADNEEVIMYEDGYPVTKGHMLLVPSDNSIGKIQLAMAMAYMVGNSFIDKGVCDGFNIGMNNGTSAGQTIMYPHIHLIPRRKGDTPNPRGGVRHVIPGKGDY